MARIINTARKAALFGVLGGMVAASTLVNRIVPLRPALDARRREFLGKRSCFLNYYVADEQQGTPLVLIHGINAAASAYEMKPLFDYYRHQRPVYALELPGFGYSERSEREYSPTLYAHAIQDFLEHLGVACDVIALSLSSEFASYAAQQVPHLFRSLSLISPTGFDLRLQSQSDDEPFLRLTLPLAGSLVELDQESLYRFLANPILSRLLFNLLTTEPSIRYFLAQSFKNKLDDGLAEYAWTTAHQEGARHAPITFVSGKLFSRQIFKTYSSLNLPVLVLYDRDPNLNFDRLPELLEKHGNWRARRIPNTLGLPHFERLDKTAEALEAFWQDAV